MEALVVMLVRVVGILCVVVLNGGCDGSSSRSGSDSGSGSRISGVMCGRDGTSGTSKYVQTDHVNSQPKHVLCCHQHPTIQRTDQADRAVSPPARQPAIEGV